MTAGDEQIQRLTARLAQLESRQQILDLLSEYSHAIDYGDEEAWVDLFEPDGTFEVSLRSRSFEPWVVVGRQALEGFIARHSRIPEAFHKHIVVDTRISIGGQGATVSSYFVVLQEADGTPVLRGFGRYNDTLRRGSDARWRFVRRLVELESLTPNLPRLGFGRLDPSDESRG